MVHYNKKDKLIGAVIEQVGLSEPDKSIISLVVRRLDGKRRDLRLLPDNAGGFIIEEFPMEG